MLNVGSCCSHRLKNSSIQPKANVLPEITLNALLRKPDHHVLLLMRTTAITAIEDVKVEQSEM